MKCQVCLSSDIPHFETLKYVMENEGVYKIRNHPELRLITIGNSDGDIYTTIIANRTNQSALLLTNVDVYAKLEFIISDEEMSLEF